ncbi:hypothetical protein BMS3Bbin12_01031 [bacterium BMS3Bbin12]|nr:hypothetical protein BMS3Abin12_01504 [bacterium BMS3Abin12]GBE47862.1 hypothetical protein BMS3Bbin12_01031 [bacterium BMS3Bbin12]GBE50160.1 hypothetical protein BMS3Bbin13_01089 [bacterium BMS3Bbin13]HDJ85556.1 DUF2065 domain-containing protein [Chromatiales bacterium]HDK02715.1 DUF2065 domain-containing protein [Gammaproteobacteria bacterium]
MWHDLLSAVALMLVIEGILPFLNPEALRRALERVACLEPRVLRLCGLFSMLGGVLLLYAAK